MNLDGCKRYARIAVAGTAVAAMTFVGTGPATAQTPDPFEFGPQGNLMELIQNTPRLLEAPVPVAPATIATTADPESDPEDSFWDKIKQEIQDRIERFPPER